MTEEENEKLIKKWEPLLNAEIASNATVLLIEPMETPFIGELKMNDYNLLNPRQKVLLWLMEHSPEHISWKIHEFYLGFVYFHMAFSTWYAIMTTDYEDSSKKIFGMSWFDVFYMELDRRRVKDT